MSLINPSDAEAEALAEAMGVPVEDVLAAAYQARLNARVSTPAEAAAETPPEPEPEAPKAPSVDDWIRGKVRRR